MNTLPPELLRCICDNFKEKKSTLKAIRLVNKNLAGVAAQLLFQTLLVYQTPKSWGKLSSVARCEWLVPYVVKLEVAALQYLPHYLDFVDWKQSTWRCRWKDQYYYRKNRAGAVSVIVEQLEAQVPTPPSNSNPYGIYEDWRRCPEVRRWNDEHSHGGDGASTVFDPKERLESLLPGLDSALGLEYRYKRYRYWHDGENELSDLMSHSEGPYPPLDLVPFPKLRTVTTLGSHEMWKGITWPSTKANRKYMETTIHPKPEAKIKIRERNLLLSLTLQMLGASEVNITRLELHRYRELLMGQTFSIPALKCLQELILDFPFGPNIGEVEVHTTLWELAPWLQGADDLRTLSILSQDPDEHYSYRYYDVIAIFHGTEWTRLQSIHFRETFVRPRSLMRFLHEHSRSLKSIRIEKPVILEETWSSLASELQALDALSPDCVMNISDCYPSREGFFDNLEDDSAWFNPKIYL